MPTKKKTGKQTAVEQLILAQLSQLNTRVGELQREVTALDEQWDERIEKIEEVAARRNTLQQESAWPADDTDEEPVPVPTKYATPIHLGWGKDEYHESLESFFQALWSAAERERLANTLRRLHDKWMTRSPNDAVAFSEDAWPDDTYAVNTDNLAADFDDADAVTVAEIIRTYFVRLGVAEDPSEGTYVLYDRSEVFNKW